MNPFTATFSEWQDNCANYDVCILNSRQKWPTNIEIEFEKKQKENYRKWLDEKEKERQQKQKKLERFISSLNSSKSQSY